MSIIAEDLEVREFKFKKPGGTTVTLPDPDPSMSTDDVLKFYSGQYPELTTASVEDPKVQDGKATFAIKTTVGTKH